jgi:tRNA(adenine34) deaminase
MYRMSKQDTLYIQRCIELAKKSLQEGEAPFSCVITRNGKVLVETINTTVRDQDATAHAEMNAMRTAQKLLKATILKDCEIYSICEPCSMCSFMIRELQIKRVIFSVFSPNMGGFSRWNVLQDTKIQAYKMFGAPPEVVGGILEPKSRALFVKADF